MSYKLLDAPVAVPAPAVHDLTGTHALRVGALLMVAHLIVLAGWQVVPTTAQLHQLAQLPQPYFVPQHFARLYLLSPLVVLASCVMLLAPGLLLALARGYGTSVRRLVLYAFPLSLVLISVVAAGAQTVFTAPVTGKAFITVVAFCTVSSLLYLCYRLATQAALPRPANRAAPTALLLALPAFLLITLTPKFYWENFNGDGAHAFEAARLLLHRAVPFWDAAAGEIAAFPGITSMLFAYPASWFIRLFGEYEVAARLPYLLYVTVLFAGIWSLIDLRRKQPATFIVPVLVAAALVVYTIVVAFSATYSPYHADIALPATQDTLLVACLIGFITTWAERRNAFTMLFAVLTYISLPNGLLLLGFWVLSVALVSRPVPWSRLAFCVTVLLACMVAGMAAPHVLTALHLPAPGGEYGFGSLLNRFRDLTLTDWRRFAFMIVPGGILPALALVLWRWQDELTRAITLVTIVTFAFFYVQAGTALHYFIPVMLLPLVVYWRLRPLASERLSVRSTVLTALALAASLWLSFPTSLAPDEHARTAGSAIEIRGDGYGSMEPVAFRRAAVMHFAFPYEWNRAVPDTTYGGSPIAWNYYANHRARATAANYIVQKTTDAFPPGTRLLGMKKQWAVYVKDDSIWQTHRRMRPVAAAGAPIYRIPRQQKFR